MIHQSTKPKSMLNFWREKLGIFQWMKNCFIIFILRNVTNRFLESQSIIDFTRFLENHLWDKEFQMLPPTSIYRTSIFRKYLILGFHTFGVIFFPKKKYSIASNSITEVSGAQNNMFVCPPRNLFFVSEVLKQFFYDPSQKSRFWIPPFVTSCNFLFNTFSD